GVSRAAPAVRLDRRAALDQPHHRAALDRGAALSGQISRGHPCGRARVHQPVLSGRGERRAARPHPGRRAARRPWAVTMRRGMYLLLVAALVLALALALAVGPYPLSVADVLHTAARAVGLENGTPTSGEIVFGRVRLPRVAAGILVGAALAGA